MSMELHSLDLGQRPVASQQSDRPFFTNRSADDEDEKPPATTVADPAAALQAPMFNSVWLSNAFLGSFLAFLMCMGVGLGILYHFANDGNGIAVLSTDHYAWMYGPTAVLVVVAGCWRQADYWCKTLVPWRELQQNWTSPDRSLLLDYVGQIHFLAAWTAIKNRHWTVVSSIGVVLLLRLMTGFSTSLLVLQSTKSIRDMAPVATTPWGFQFPFTKAPTHGFSGYNPFDVAYGLMAQDLPYPAGTSDDFLVQPFQVKGPVPSDLRSITANVTGVWPLLYCEPLDVTWQLNGTSSSSNAVDEVVISFNVTDGLCSSGEPWYQDVTTTLHDRQRTILPDRLVYVRMSNFNAYCGDDQLEKPRLFFATLDARYTQNLVPNAEEIVSSNYNTPVIATSSTLEIVNVTGVICRQDFQMNMARVQIDPSDANTQSGPGLNATPIGPIPGLPSEVAGWPLNDAISSDIITGIRIMLSGISYSLGDDLGTEVASKALFRLMLVNSGYSDYTPFLDPQELMKTVSKVWRTLIVQTIYVLYGSEGISNDTNLAATGIYEEGRLFVQKTPIALMEACLLVIIVLTVLVMLYRPDNVVPRSPDTVGAIATFLAGSSRLTGLLDGHGHMDNDQLKKTLEGQRFSTRVDPREIDGQDRHAFSILTEQHIVKKDEMSSTPPQDLSPRFGKPKKIWTPLAYDLPFRLMALITPLALIIILEVLQHQSDRLDGILQVPNNSTTTIFSKYIPAFVILCVSLIYPTFDSGISLLAPFRSLSQSNTSHKWIFVNYLRDMPVVAMWKSIRDGQLAVFLSLLGAITASLFTIAVSGLYNIDTTNISSQTTSVDRTDVWNLSWADGYSDNSAGAIFSLVEHANLSSRRLIWDDLVFPTMRSPVSFDDLNATDAKNQSTARMTLRVPALRPKVNCTALDSATLYSETKNSFLLPSKYIPYASLQTIVDLKTMYPHCVRGGTYGNETVTKFNTTIYFPEQLTNENTSVALSGVHGGRIFDLHAGPLLHSAKGDLNYQEFVKWGKEDVWVNTMAYEDWEAYPRSIYSAGNNPDGCPSLGFTFGEFAPGSNNTTNVTTGVCDQLVEEVMTDATFLLPGLELDTAHPPVPDESTAHVLDNGRGSNTHQYRPQYHISSATVYFVNDMRNYTDIFYQTVVYGLNAVPVSELMGSANIPRLFKAINDSYSKYMALAISLNMRQAMNQTDQTNASSLAIAGQNKDTTYSALVVSPASRLKQDRASKIALQILLAISFLCTAIACLLAWKPVRLMHNPAPIAGAASLVAGSELCTRKFLPEGSEWMSEKEMRRQGIFSGLMFRLGWINQEDSGKERYGIDIVDNRVA
ncbi:hypothetical protein AWENTII_011904 [Aspergillus wentii]